MKKSLHFVVLSLIGFILMMPITQAQSFDDYQLDTSVPSFSGVFTITIPGDLLSASSIERSPNNITLTNNWDIFTANGLMLGTGDVLLIADYYGDSTMLNVNDDAVDASVREITEALADANGRETSDIEALVIGDYEGYQFDAVDVSGLLIHTAVIDFSDGAFLTFVMVTTAQEEQDTLMPLFTDIIASLKAGVVLEPIVLSNTALPEIFIRDADGFTMPYPEGWSVEVNTVGQSQFVTVTKGHTFSLDTPPSPGQPSAIVAYGTVDILTGLPLTMLDPASNATRVIQQIVGSRATNITRLDVEGYAAAKVIAKTPNFDNLIVAIMLDDRHFVVANMFTAPDEDSDFGDVMVEMLMQATWDEDEPIESDADTSVSDNSEVFTPTDTGLSLKLPADWSGFAMSSEIIGLINEDGAFTKLTSQQTPETGQATVLIFTHKLINNLGDDLESRLAQLNDAAFTDGVADLEAVEFGDRTIYMAESQAEDGDKLVILIPIDDNYVLLSALTAPDELDHFRDTLVDVALSIVMTE